MAHTSAAPTIHFILLLRVDGVTYAIPIIQGEQNWRKSVSAYLAQLALGANMLQMVSFETGAVATGTTLIPYDDTIPQNTEGDQYMSLAITPKSATSRLEICISAQFSNKGASTNNNVIGALFQDSIANALAASIAGMYTAQAPTQFLMTHVMSSPGTGTYTFKFRAGSQLAGGVVMNGVSGGTRTFGGVEASTMIIREYA